MKNKRKTTDFFNEVVETKSLDSKVDNPENKKLGFKKRTLLIIGAISLIFLCIFCSLVYTFSAWTITSIIQTVNPDYGVFKKNVKVPYEKAEFTVNDFAVKGRTSSCEVKTVEVEITIKNISSENIDLSNYSYILKDRDQRSYTNLKNNNSIISGVLQPQRTVRDFVYFCATEQTEVYRLEISTAKNTRYISINLR